VLSDCNSQATLSLPGVVSTDLLNVAASSNVDGLAGLRNATASASINNINLGLTLVLTSVLSRNATAIQSSATVSGEPLSGAGTTGITGGSISVLGAAPTAIPTNPAANTSLINSNGIQVILNEQILSGSLGLTVNAIHIILINVGGLGINGNITLAHSQAQLTSNVPEPSTALLVSLGFVGLAARRRSLR
jgi:hypothetical protein